jgi:hypothetical protein
MEQTNKQALQCFNMGSSGEAKDKQAIERV